MWAGLVANGESFSQVKRESRHSWEIVWSLLQDPARQSEVGGSELRVCGAKRLKGRNGRMAEKVGRGQVLGGPGHVRCSADSGICVFFLHGGGG